ncbi:hypothetical protein D3C78_1555840 [compost metagenome]
MLPGDVALAALDGEGGDKGVHRVVVAVDADAGQPTRGGLGAVGGNHQPGGKLATAAQRHQAVIALFAQRLQQVGADQLDIVMLRQRLLAG